MAARYDIAPGGTPVFFAWTVDGIPIRLYFWFNSQSTTPNPAMMKLLDYYRSLRYGERAEYADRAGTSLAYLNNHLMRKEPTRRPRKDLLKRLAAATRRKVTLTEVKDHFGVD